MSVPKLQIEVFNDPMFQENGYLVWAPGAADCWIIDPGFAPQPAEMAARIAEEGLRPVAIILTHAHPDHFAGAGPLQRRFAGLPLWCPRDEAELLRNADANLSAGMGLPVVGPAPDVLLDSGRAVEFCGMTWEARDVAGHSPGALAFYSAAAGVAFVGDAVFAEGLGRYDFPHSSRERLLRNIRENLLTLPDATTIYSGHGPPATIGAIKRFNQSLKWELANE